MTDKPCPMTNLIRCDSRYCELHYMDAPLRLQWGGLVPLAQPLDNPDAWDEDAYEANREASAMRRLGFGPGPCSACGVIPTDGHMPYDPGCVDIYADMRGLIL